MTSLLKSIKTFFAQSHYTVTTVYIYLDSQTVKDFVLLVTILCGGAAMVTACYSK
jgi:hypothetical protein